MSKANDLLKSLGGGGAYKGMVADATPPGLDPSAAQAPPPLAQGVTRRKDVFSIPLDRIVPDPDQPRTEFDEGELARLAESLGARGQLQPIRVRKDEGRGVYVILVGERRYRAARLAGLAELQAIVVEGDLPAEERLMIQLVENALREDLRPVEQARSYRRLMEARGWSITQLARELSVSQAAASKALALLDLPAAVQDQVEQGALAPHTAYEVSRLDDPEAQAQVARAAAEQKLTRDEVAEVVKAVRARRPTPAPKPDPVSIDLGSVVVSVRWKKADGPDAAKALRQALKVIQARAEEAAA